MKQTNSLWYKLKWFFLENINWCHPVKRDGTGKGDSWFYTLYCYLFYPIPFMEHPCWCCASARGILYGFVLGLIAGVMYGL